MPPPYTDFFGSGEALYAQLVTLGAIALSILVWRAIYQRLGIWKEFITIAIFPLILWIIFGSLDVTITARFAYLHPEAEGNPEARWFFEQFGFGGGVLASMAWISLWAAIMAVALKYLHNTMFSSFVVRSILYGLAFGHLLGFSTWMVWLKPIAAFRNLLYTWRPLPHVFAGMLLGSLHSVALSLFKTQTPK